MSKRVARPEAGSSESVFERCPEIFRVAYRLDLTENRPRLAGLPVDRQGLTCPLFRLCDHFVRRRASDDASIVKQCHADKCVGPSGVERRGVLEGRRRTFEVTRSPAILEQVQVIQAAL